MVLLGIVADSVAISMCIKPKPKQIVYIKPKDALEASVVQWLCHWPCKPGVAGSIPGFSSPSDGTINRGPVSK